MYLRRYRGVWHAHFFTIVILVSSLLRVAVLGVFMPFALVLERGRADWTRVRIRRSLALVEWCLSSRKHFYSRIAGFFDLAKPNRLESLA